LVAATKLDLDDITSELIISDSLGTEIEEGDLGLALGNFAKEIVHFLTLRKLESQNPIKWM
jgi:hypothetical protein